MTDVKHEEEAAADQLEEAARLGIACAPVSELLSGKDLASGYRVQLINTERAVAAGRAVAGRKIGLTSDAVQRQLGVDQPDIGVLFADMAVASGDVIEHGRLIQPRVEAEVAFVLGEDLVGAVSATRARDAVAYATVAIEVVDSRIGGWRITLVDTVADNASSGLFVLGEDRIESSTDFSAIEMQMVDRGGMVVASGSGAACLGDPLNALAWLAEAVQRFDRPLRAGEVILSGALGPMVDAPPGAAFEARLDGFGSVTVGFGELRS